MRSRDRSTRAWTGLALVVAVVGCGARTSLSSGSESGDAAPSIRDATRDSLEATMLPEDAPVLPACGYAAATLLARVEFDTEGFAAQLWLCALTPVGGALWIGAEVEDGEYNGDGFVERVPTAGGALVDVTGSLGDPAHLQRYAGGYLVQDGARIYYSHPTFPDGTIVYPSLVARPLDGAAGGPETPIPNPLPGHTTVTAIGATGAGGTGVIWASYNEEANDGWLLHWDPTTGSSIVATTPDVMSQLFLVAGVAFLAGPRGLYDVRLAGGVGVAEELRPWGENAGLLAVNETTLFFTPDGTSLVARDAVSGVETTLATGLTVGTATMLFSSTPLGYADADFLYVAAMGGVARVPVGGGGLEVFVPDVLPVQALAGDACNLYWVTPSPDSSTERVMAVAKRGA